MNTLVTTSIEAAAREIRSGNVVAFPTETVYGLGANAFDAHAVQKVFEAKNRPPDNPIIVHIWSKRQLNQIAKSLSPKTKKLIQKFFPGPLSVVVQKSKAIPSIVTASLPTVCVRMPSLSITRRFLKACGVPVAAPSANLSGRPSPTSWQHALHDLDGKIPLILKGPLARHGLESTVIDCSRDPPVLLRAGAIPLEEIEKVIGAVLVQTHSQHPSSPGMRYRHYAPQAKLVLVRNAKELPQKKGNWAYVGVSKIPRLLSAFSFLPSTLEQYARGLYHFLRRCDELGIETIYAELPPEKSVGRALVDRLRRASQK